MVLVFILFAYREINNFIIRQIVCRISKEDLSGYINTSFKEIWEKI